MPENELYVLSSGDRADDDAEAWVQPRPIPTAIADAVSAATDVDDPDVEAAIDHDRIADLLDDEDAGADETVTFSVAGHDVTVDGTGHIDVAE